MGRQTATHEAKELSAFPEATLPWRADFFYARLPPFANRFKSCPSQRAAGPQFVLGANCEQPSTRLILSHRPLRGTGGDTNDFFA